MERYWIRRVRLGAILLLTLPLLFSVLTPSVMAGKPKVESVTWYLQGTSTTVELSIRHISGGAGGEYVNQAEVKVGDKVYTITILPGGGERITESVDLGVITGTPTVQARARCSADGWGDWTSPVTIPEFPITPVVLFIAALTMMALSLRLTTRKRL